MPDHIYVHGSSPFGRQDFEVARHRHQPAAPTSNRHEPEWLRYYIAAKLERNVEESRLQPRRFCMARVNSDLVGKYVNIATAARRSSTGKSAQAGCGAAGFRIQRQGRRTRVALPSSASSARRCRENHGTRSRREPVRRRAEAVGPHPGAEQKLQQVCSVAINLFRLLTIYLKPVLPRNWRPEPAGSSTWRRCGGHTPERLLPAGHRINEYRHLLIRVEETAGSVASRQRTRRERD